MYTFRPYIAFKALIIHLVRRFMTFLLHWYNLDSYFKLHLPVIIPLPFLPLSLWFLLLAFLQRHHHNLFHISFFFVFDSSSSAPNITYKSKLYTFGSVRAMNLKSLLSIAKENQVILSLCLSLSGYKYQSKHKYKPVTANIVRRLVGTGQPCLSSDNLSPSAYLPLPNVLLLDHGN